MIRARLLVRRPAAAVRLGGAGGSAGSVGAAGGVAGA